MVKIFGRYIWQRNMADMSAWVVGPIKFGQDICMRLFAEIYSCSDIWLRYTVNISVWYVWLRFFLVEVFSSWDIFWIIYLPVEIFGLENLLGYLAKMYIAKMSGQYIWLIYILAEISSGKIWIWYIARIYVRDILPRYLAETSGWNIFWLVLMAEISSCGIWLKYVYEIYCLDI